MIGFTKDPDDDGGQHRLVVGHPRARAVGSMSTNAMHALPYTPRGAFGSVAVWLRQMLAARRRPSSSRTSSSSSPPSR
ncbi:hypothetical protein [Promicromonospora sp. NPDC023805]|uniref:hypothetical protein n=1 Tax=Promicromonospora sp. NPDC023805 TaxID=3154696 RepID=UPI0034021587